jgi:hypothetical protein
LTPLWCESVDAREWHPVTHEKTVYTFAVVWHVEHVSPVWRPDVMGNAVCVNRPWVHAVSLDL